MESVQNTLSALRELFETKLSELRKDLNKASPPSATSSSAITELSLFQKFIMSALETIQQQIDILARDMDRLEMRGRRKMLLFHGVPENEDEDTASTVASVISNKLSIVDFTAASVSRAHRLGRPKEKKSRPIVVKVKDTAMRDKIWFAKKKLKSSGITQSEFLTKNRHNIFMEARQRFGISKCWTMEGYIHVIAPDGSRHKVETMAELESIPSESTPSPELPAPVSPALVSPALVSPTQVSPAPVSPAPASSAPAVKPIVNKSTANKATTRTKRVAKK